MVVYLLVYFHFLINKDKVDRTTQEAIEKVILWANANIVDALKGSKKRKLCRKLLPSSNQTLMLDPSMLEGGLLQTTLSSLDEQSVDSSSSSRRKEPGSKQDFIQQLIEVCSCK